MTVQPADPVFLLAAPRSMSSVVCAMLGRHPQMYGLPETHLFREETMDAWWRGAAGETFRVADGLLRAVAQICYGGQTDATVRLASGWLRRRNTHTSGMVLEELARRVHPLVLVDKSPNMVYQLRTMRRAHGFFPEARFVHLVRHPRGYCASVLSYLRTLSAGGAVAPDWIGRLASYPHQLPGVDPLPGLDPQGGWYVLNRNVVTFLDELPARQWTTVRAEDLVGDPMIMMTRLAAWLGLRDDTESVAPVLHPERSPFACLGPPSAPYGNDLLFLRRPALRPGKASEQNLDTPLPWRADGAGFLPEVARLAGRLGYR
jgi:hypothetical protein